MSTISRSTTRPEWWDSFQSAQEADRRPYVLQKRVEELQLMLVQKEFEVANIKTEIFKLEEEIGAYYNAKI